MKFNAIRKISFFCFLFLTVALNGQDFRTRNYNTESGIPNNFIYSINQSQNGFLWVGTGNGISRFDGYDFYPVLYPDSISVRNTSACFRDSQGTLWFGSSDGSVFFTVQNTLVSLKLNNTGSISQILESRDSMLFIIPQGKNIFVSDPGSSEVKSYSIQGEHIMLSASFTGYGKLLIGTQGNILICSLSRDKDSVIIEKTIQGFDYSGVTSITNMGNDRYVIGTEDNGLFRMWLNEDSMRLSRFNDKPGWSSLKIKSVFVDPLNRIWASTFGSGVIRFSMNEQGAAEQVQVFDKSSGLPSDDAKVVFMDSEDNYWIGLFGEGIYMLSSSPFSHYMPGKSPSQNNILFIGDEDDKYILGTPEGFHVFDQHTGKSLSFTDLSARTGNSQILSYCLDNRKLWIGTNGKGLFLRNTDGSIEPYYKSGDSGSDKINDIQVDESYIWLATTNGIIVLDKEKRTVKKTINIEDGLLAKGMNKIFLNDGKAYIGAESNRLFMIDQQMNVSPMNCLMTGNGINRIVSISKDRKGGIWIATSGNGIFNCSDDSLFAVNRSTGLFSNYCYCIFADSENNIWTGHAKGLSRYDIKNKVLNTFGADIVSDGICNNAVFESPDKRLFIGTTKGMVIYDRNRDNKNKIPPYSNVNSIIINDKRYDIQPVIELPYSKYRITIKYSGVNFSDPDRVLYQSFLENYDTKPCKITASREINYVLGDGEYRFNLISMDENGLHGKSVGFSIIIGKPVYKKIWFFLFIVIFFTGIVILIIKEREKLQKKSLRQLEEELDKRTGLIMKQKEEIEIQNLEITDSINYAKRIQASILPDISKLRENFEDAFILFHPRDIVSGDFYWFDKVDQDKFIVVCADSTGHGVPGAFMSMIGSTLLQDIVTRKKITRPSKILGLLDKQIFSTLNQNEDIGVSKDGMDMVVCEFNIRTRHVRFSSAMRPIIMVMSGESHYIKGNRSSIGGESAVEKYFIDQEYFLSEGDTVYLFTDGLPDQFGGPEGKKMKIARLKRMIDQIAKLPMREQERIMTDYYYEWKGSYEQVDDILLMGIRV